MSDPINALTLETIRDSLAAIQALLGEIVGRLEALEASSDAPQERLKGTAN